MARTVWLALGAVTAVAATSIMMRLRAEPTPHGRGTEAPVAEAPVAESVRHAPVVEPVRHAPVAESPVAESARPAVEKDPGDALRWPVIKAVRTRYPTEIARRDAMVQALESSGPSRESWTTDARDSFEAWRSDAASGSTTVRVDGASCFRGGCKTVATFADEATYAAAEARTPSLTIGWKGGWMQTPPERLPSGELVVTWILLRPDAT